MVKTRSKSICSTIKKEEHEDKPKPEKKLRYTTNNASKSKNKITKNKSLTQAKIEKVKPENLDGSKSLLASPLKTFTRTNITKEKIAKLINYIVNDKIDLDSASKIVGMHHNTACKYYKRYQEDPEHKIPEIRRRPEKEISTITQENIDNVIRYVVGDGMNLNQASKRAGISRDTAARYYAKYLDNPEQKLLLLDVCTGNASKRYTQEEIGDFIGYIVRDNMPLVEAAKKANMSQYTARKYYLKYLLDPNHKIPDPGESCQRSVKRCTNDQVKSLIGYIVNDGKTLMEASVKANMTIFSATKYYKQYSDDPENNIPTPETYHRRVSTTPPKDDQVRNFFCYVIIDGLKVPQAARKAKLSRSTGWKYYNEYLKGPSNQPKIKDMSYSVDKMKRLVKLVQNKKMSLVEAAGVVDLNIASARTQYQQYLKNPQYVFPAKTIKQYTQEDIKKLIDYIERDRMSLTMAARKAEISLTTVYKYYKEYLNDPEHKIPSPILTEYARRNKKFYNYKQIVADIYKNNPSIKPIYKIHDPELIVPDTEIKEELVEEDDKMLLKTEHI